MFLKLGSANKQQLMHITKFKITDPRQISRKSVILINILVYHSTFKFCKIQHLIG